MADPNRCARLGHEKEDYLGFRWWPCAEVVASRANFQPVRLSTLPAAILAGEEIDEPLELRS